MFEEGNKAHEGRTVYVFSPASGNTRKFDSVYKVKQFLDTRNQRGIYESLNNGKLFGNYLLGYKKPTKVEKMRVYLEYWDKVKGLPPEKWGRYNERYLVSNWGRVKRTDTGEFVIPFLATSDNRMVAKYKREVVSVARMVMSVFVKGSHLNNNEYVCRIRGIMHECFPNCFEIVSKSEQIRRARLLGARTRSKECAKLNEEGEVIEIYKSRREAAKHNHISQGQIDRVCRGIQKRAGGELYKSTRGMF